MSLTTERLIDAANYELTQIGPNMWEWTEGSMPVGVRLEADTSDGKTLLHIISHETNQRVTIDESRIETHLRPLMDVMQFSAQWNQQDWPLEELVSVLNAVNREYAISGDNDGITIFLSWGMHLHKQQVGYAIVDGEGIAEHAGTVAGLQRLYARMAAREMRNQIRLISRYAAGAR